MFKKQTKEAVIAEQSPRCAWCLCEQGLELGNGSHGICPRHAQELLQQFRERRTRPCPEKLEQDMISANIAFSMCECMP